MRLRLTLFLLLLLVGLQSCVSKKEIVYLQEYQNNNITKSLQNYEPVIQRDDVLFIQIVTTDPIAASPFNLGMGGEQMAMINLAQGAEPFTYLVAADGTIDMPTIGNVKVEGLTKTQCRILLEEKLAPLLKNPIINIRTVNFRVSVLGEVNRPGIVAKNSDRMTVLEALAGAGDLTIFGKRTNILLIREINGVQSTYTIDLTNANFMQSPYYYLQNNDVLYVEPRAARRDSSAVGANAGIVISAISLLLTAIVLFRR
ncbi:MAG: polysaccharide biosynthesis/export family protein [Flavobacteriales bacterium]|jgi:polysaccharide biosynthesis/export protein|nr:polysaccharide biosynthesis/export family protein [Flavobacteriales bacterium]